MIPDRQIEKEAKAIQIACFGKDQEAWRYPLDITAIADCMGVTFRNGTFRDESVVACLDAEKRTIYNSDHYDTDYRRTFVEFPNERIIERNLDLEELYEGIGYLLGRLQFSDVRTEIVTRDTLSVGAFSDPSRAIAMRFGRYVTMDRHMLKQFEGQPGSMLSAVFCMPPEAIEQARAERKDRALLGLYSALLGGRGAAQPICYNKV